MIIRQGDQSVVNEQQTTGSQVGDVLGVGALGHDDHVGWLGDVGMVDGIARDHNLGAGRPASRLRAIALGEGDLKAIVDGPCLTNDLAGTDNALPAKPAQLKLGAGDMIGALG